MTDRRVKSSKQEVRIVYINWRNEKGTRNIVPLEIWYGSTEWHKDEQWLLKAIDVEKKAERDFALKDIQSWNQVAKV